MSRRTKKAAKLLADLGCEIVALNAPDIALAKEICDVISCVEFASMAARYDGVKFGYRAASDELKQKHPDVLWREMKGMRNFVTHQYFGVELSDIWSTAVNDIPLLKKQIQQMLKDMESAE